ncbi:MAG: hypothetical protein NUW01_03750 [Gemmatimonadaceae bacterium]|nr:hypothetical protein [Gemmatimonadaceae bacterium]
MSDEAARMWAQMDAALEAFRATGCTIEVNTLRCVPAGVRVQLWHCGGLGPVGIDIDSGTAPDDVAALVYDGMTHGRPHGREV